MTFGLHPGTRRRLAAICGLMSLTREPGSIEALVREYLREVGRPCA